MATTIAVFYEASFALEKDGAQARVAAMLDRLCARFVQITVYSYSNHHRFPWTDRCLERFSQRWPSAKLVLEDYTPLLKLSSSLKNLLVSLFPSHAARFIRQSVPFAAGKFKPIRRPGTLCLVNHKFGLTQLNGVDPSYCFVDTHDLLWLKAARLGGQPLTSLGILRKLRGEVAALNTVRGVLAISPPEAAFFKLALSNVKTFYVPLWEMQPASAEISLTPAEFDLVFVASDYVMNVRGFEEMLRIEGHWIGKYRIAVCGRICQHPDIVSLAFKYKNITLLGFVEDLEGLFRKCKAAIAPVEGTGLKIKIISALRFGLPAFASHQARDGLPVGHEEAVFPIARSTMVSVLEDDSALRRAKDAALQYYVSFLSISEADLVLDNMRSLMFDDAEPESPADLGSAGW